ncbi:AraC family transcriptional regulator [Pseudonocardia hierapolitana]|uniref:AraC family transcriptional regulator n=1 Tax=Pseudonocardia hierapolitana TaxID=1128676 RepID=UPI0011BF454C|nr:AraC family transcriptional regulator [Pseudonocardia hierapolitana]
MTEPYERFPGLCLVRTSDLDEALGRMGEVYLPHRIDLLDAGSTLDVQLNALRLGSVTAGYVRYGAEIRMVTAEARDYHVNIPLVGRARSRSGRRDPVFTAPGRAAIFMPGAPAEIEWGAGSAQLSLMLDRRAVDRELERLLGHPLSRPLEFAVGMDLTTPAGASFLAALDLVEREAGRPDGMLRFPAAAAHLEGLVIHGLLLAQPHNHSDELRHGDASLQPRAVRQAVELIEERPEHAWTITELAATVAVSVRTLQDRFAQSVGIPPMTYLRDVRLDRVHAQLLAADPHEVTVGSVAASWGFLHAGRFAVAYKRRFGRSPSATLRSG